jgi:hypothetical protein
MSSQTPNKKTSSSNNKQSAGSGSNVKKATTSQKTAQGKSTAAASAKVKQTSPAKESAVSKISALIKNYNFRLRKQKYKYGTIATIFTVAVVTSIILLNVLVGIITDKYGIKFDMTSDKRFEITDDTISVLKNLDKKVNIDVFMSEDNFRAQTYGNEMAEILYKYKVYGGDMIGLTFVDPLRNPTYADKYKSEVTITEGTVVVQGGEDFSAIVPDSLYYWYDASHQQAVGTSIERKVTTSILNLSLKAENKPTAAILWGHNELNLKGLQTLLAESSYNVIVLNLLTDDIPDNVSLMIINSPSTDYTVGEIDKIEKYLDKHKNLIFFYGSEVPELTELELLFKEWGATFANSVVCDSTYRVLGEYYNIVTVPSTADNELTQGLGINQYVIMPYSREMHTARVDNSLVTVTELLSTSSVSYSKSLAGGPILSNERENKDTAGPFSSAILTTKNSVINNLNVYSNVLFISSPYLYNENLLSTESYGNLRFTTNILAKFNSANATVNIASKKYTDPELKIVGNSLTVMLFLLCTIPAATLVSGLLVWHRRKNR